jgi:hypothetical protein
MRFSYGGEYARVGGIVQAKTASDADLAGVTTQDFKDAKQNGRDLHRARAIQSAFIRG